MAQAFNLKYPSIDDLRKKAKRKMPKFAFEYLDGGCNEDLNLIKNTKEIRDVELKPEYLTKHEVSSLKTKIFNQEFIS